MYNEENNEEIRIQDKETEMEIKSYLDLKTGLVHQDWSGFFSHSLNDDQD